MEYEMDGGAERRLRVLFSRIGDVLGNARRRASFAAYALGLLSEGERKSMEPIASRTCGDPDEAGAIHERLQHFVTESEWDDRAVRRVAHRHALSAMDRRERIHTWIVDDTGFLKQGTHSVGVQRQYTGSAGKTTNCQVGVSLSVTTRTEHLPIDFALFLPESWTEDPERRRKAKIPEEVTFATKHDLALSMLEQAVRDQ